MSSLISPDTPRLAEPPNVLREALGPAERSPMRISDAIEKLEALAAERSKEASGV